MKFALFLGCNIPVRLKSYETASRAVLGALGVSLVDIPAFNCCGYPLRNIDFKAFVLSAARNMALAERAHLPMLMLCQCGYGTLRMATHLMRQNPDLRQEVNTILAREELTYEGAGEVKHLFTVLSKDVGLEAIRQKVARPYENLKIATHYGCHGLRPSKVVTFDDPVAPSLFDALVQVTGAESVDWPLKLACCGGPLLGTNDALSFSFTDRKLADAKKAGAHYLATGCSFCQIQFDTARKETTPDGATNDRVPPLLYPQLLGCAMGIGADLLGLGNHSIGNFSRS